jgi:hypothetical protein
VETELKTIDKKEDSECTYSKEQEKDPLDFIIGPKPKTDKELTNIIENADKYTEKEYLDAKKDLQCIYGTYYGSENYKEQVEDVKKNKSPEKKTTSKRLVKKC